MKIGAVILWLLIATSVFAQTTQVTFAWDPDAEAITGFKLYQSKQSGNYTSTPVATFTPGTLVTGSIPKPTSFGRYYYVLTAYAVDTTVTPNVTTESGYSNEVTLVVNPRPPKLNSAILAAIRAPIDLVKWVMKGNHQEKGLRVVS